MSGVLLGDGPTQEVTKLSNRAWLATPDVFGRRLSNGTWVPARHHRMLGWLLYLLSIGYLKRMTVALPPGHGKTQLIGHWFPAWDLELRPEDRIIYTSYAATLAEESGKAARDIVTDHASVLTTRLDPSAGAIERWRTTQKGGMWSVGMGGSVTGRRARIFVVDDPFKGEDDSRSEAQRDHVWAWFRSVARTRLLPGASMVVVQTRWHSEDLIGHLEGLPQWVHIRLPAIAEEDEDIRTVVGDRFYRRCKRDGVWLPEWHRKKGEALWPWLIPPDANGENGTPWFDEAELKGVEDEVGPWTWSTLYQQRPYVLEGDMFKMDDWTFVDSAPNNLLLVRRWDFAGTQGGGDYTAGVLMGRHPSGRTYILDVRRRQVGSNEKQQWVKRTAQEDFELYGGKVKTRIEQEGGSAGKDVAEHWVANVLPEFAVEFEGSSGPKEVRAEPLSAQQKQGTVFIVRQRNERGEPIRPKWFEDFAKEAAAFPDGGANDDMIDAASLAFTDLIKMMRRRRKAQTRSMARDRIGDPGATGFRGGGYRPN